MEHSALHAIQVIGVLLTLSGPLFVLGLIDRSSRTAASHGVVRLYALELRSRASQCVCWAALVAAAAAGADLLVQTAELTGHTIFAGVNPGLLVEFAMKARTGQLALARLGLFVAIAILARTHPQRWGAVAILAMLAALSTSFVSHAAAQPSGRGAAILTQLSHLCGAAAWLGVLMHLLGSRQLIERHDRGTSVALTAEMIRRFSPIALGAVTLLMISGLMAAARFAKNLPALFTSAYGLTLLVKLSLLGLVGWAGYLNFRVIRPALLHLARAREGSHGTGLGPSTPLKATMVLSKFGRLLELEVTAGLLVVTVAGVVSSVAPPAGPGKQQLTTLQTRALLSPHWPRTSLPDPSEFYGAPERTLGDLHYAEFTHNWSGVAVALVGLCWLAQTVGAPWGGVAARLWPGLLVLFGIFIAAVSDPEVWLLRRVTLWQVLGDPQVLEHQLGAVMVFGLAWFAWRDRLRPPFARPLGYVLPGVMICGSLLLLGHAHSALNTGEELTSLINVQHAILGALGLFAGTIRWLSLRKLIPNRIAGWTWPALVILLGLFLAFFYREAI